METPVIEVNGNAILTMIIMLLVIAGIMLLIREVNCWYWKINKRVELAEKANSEIRALKNELQTQNELISQILKEIKKEDGEQLPTPPTFSAIDWRATLVGQQKNQITSIWPFSRQLKLKHNHGHDFA